MQTPNLANHIDLNWCRESERNLILKILKANPGNIRALEDFFIRAGVFRKNFITVIARRDRDEYGENTYTLSGRLEDLFHYEPGHSLPVGFIVEVQTQKRNVRRIVYYDRLKSVRPYNPEEHI
jgi:hypothetical protein